MWVLKWSLAFIFIITVTTALRSPYNPRMEAVNTRYILIWDWDQTQANFTAEYTYSTMKNISGSYRRVCYRTAERHCDFSFAKLFYSACYMLRVQAEVKRENSPWSFLHFCPDVHAALGPPSHVEVQSGEAMLTISITEPLTVYNTPMSDFLPLSYRVQYWEKHTPQRNGTLELKATRTTLTELKPQTDYCLRVYTFHREEEKTSPYTSTQCVKTLGRAHHPGWYMFLFLCCVVLATWLILLRRDKIRSFFLHPTLPSSIKGPPPSAICHFLEPQEENCTVLVLVDAQAPQCPREDRRAEQASAQWQGSSGQDSGISSGLESDDSCLKLNHQHYPAAWLDSRE